MSIDMHEMMLGNWVNWTYLDYDSFVTYPRQVTNSFFSLPEKELKEFEPIPLTPEILSKIEKFKEGIELRFNQGVCYVDFKGNTLTAITYVHELQNLYKLLSGKELIINLWNNKQ